MTCENSMEFQHPWIVLLEHSHVHSFTDSCFHTTTAQMSSWKGTACSGLTFYTTTTNSSDAVIKSTVSQIPCILSYHILLLFFKLPVQN